MRPIVFDGCFGWLHLPAKQSGSADGTIGAVMCSPFGYEALCTHQGWRELAETFAAHGIPAIRFDYPGAGDSVGDEADPDRFGAWIASIRHAVAHLKMQTGVERIVLVGLRLGATLAAVAAEQLGGVDSLIMMSPVLSGKNYVRELRAHYQTWLSTSAGMTAEVESDDSRYVGTYGFRLYQDSLAQLLSLDLLEQTAPPAARILVLDSFDHKRAQRLAAHYQNLDAQVRVQPFPECDKFLLEARFSETPRAAYRALLAWCNPESAVSASAPAAGDSAATAIAGVAPIPVPASIPVAASSAVTTPIAGATLEAAPGVQLLCDTGIETPVTLGDQRLFGMFCEPRQALDDAPAVLIVNTGGAHHVGDARLSVLLARRLGAQGIASLRMDLGGLGDSYRRTTPLTLATLYAQHATVDAHAGVDWLCAAGHRRVVVFGVCAGAYVSLHTASTHPNVVGCVPVNLQSFLWTSAPEQPDAPAHHVESTGVYWRSIRNPEKWRKLLSGQGNGRSIVTGLAKRLSARLASRASAPLERLLGLKTSSGEVRELVARLNRNSVQTSLVYGELDVGLEELKIHFGPNGARLAKLANVNAAILPKLDHALFSAAARETVIGHVETFLRERIGPSSPVLTRSTAAAGTLPAAPGNTGPISTAGAAGLPFNVT
jgi:pimeloyl-ACP methyl ester carboxylesterase